MFRCGHVLNSRKLADHKQHGFIQASHTMARVLMIVALIRLSRAIYPVPPNSSKLDVFNENTDWIATSQFLWVLCSRCETIVLDKLQRQLVENPNPCLLAEE